MRACPLHKEGAASGCLRQGAVSAGEPVRRQLRGHRQWGRCPHFFWRRPSSTAERGSPVALLFRRPSRALGRPAIRAAHAADLGGSASSAEGCTVPLRRPPSSRQPPIRAALPPTLAGGGPRGGLRRRHPQRPRHERTRTVLRPSSESRNLAVSLSPQPASLTAGPRAAGTAARIEGLPASAARNARRQPPQPPRCQPARPGPAE